MARFSASTAAVDRPDVIETVIRPRPGWIEVNWKELYDYRELLYYLTWRDIKVRYKQTVLGVAWAVIQPLFTMLIFTLIFGRFAGMPSEGVPYPVYVFAGLIPWTLFAGGLTAASQSLVQQQNVLTKVYFPRLFVPTATLGPFLVDSLVSFPLYGLILLYYGVVPHWQSVFVPALLGLTVMVSLGTGFALSALIVVYRDVRHLIPFMIQILLFASPVIYPARLVPTGYRWVLALNPLCGIIDAFRSSILGTPWNFLTLSLSVGVTFFMFAFGLYYFRKTERLLADIA
jgi:lipopolysaccharide transport system permease protein